MIEQNEEKVYPAEEQGISKEETSEELQQDIATGEKDEEVYTKEGREQLVEDGEITPEEDAFMEGEENEGELGDCANCGKALTEEKDKVIEKEIHGNIVWFCSDKCLEEFEKKEETVEEFPVEEEPEEESPEEEATEEESEDGRVEEE